MTRDPRPRKLEYYRDPDGDYLAVNKAACVNPWDCRGFRQFEGRAACIRGKPETVNTTCIAALFLARCTRIRKRDVPPAWQERIS